VGSHTITADYAGNGSFTPSVSNAVIQVVNPPTDVAPTVVLLQRFGFHNQPTSLVLTFSTALEAAQAQNVSNYRIVALGGHQAGHVIKVRSAVYNPATLTVTLFLAQQLDLHKQYQLTVNGTAPNGLAGATGLLLDGQGNGVPGSSYGKTITGKLLAGPALAPPLSRDRPALATLSQRTGGPRASGVDALAATGELAASPIEALGLDTAARSGPAHRRRTHRVI
jgi:hypothetical protein